MSKMEPHINTSNMTIQEVAVDAVTPYENNPRKIPQEAIDRVAASIKEYKFFQEIVPMCSCLIASQDNSIAPYFSY